METTLDDINLGSILTSPKGFLTLISVVLCYSSLSYASINGMIDTALKKCNTIKLNNKKVKNTLSNVILFTTYFSAGGMYH